REKAALDRDHPRRGIPVAKAGVGLMRLSRKVALLAVTNLVLLAAILLVFFRWQFETGPQSLLLGPVQDRIMAIANRFSVELSGAPEPTVSGIFTAYRQRYGADFYLMTPSAETLAGPQVDLPPEVIERMRRPLDHFGR